MKRKFLKVLLILFFFVSIANICSAQNTARGIAAEKIAVEQNDNVKKCEPRLYFPTGVKYTLSDPIYSLNDNVVARFDYYTNSVIVWDVGTGKEIKIIKLYTGCNTIVFSPNGRFLATGCKDKVIRIYDLVTGNEVSRFVGHSDAVISLVYSPDGKYLSSLGEDGTIRIWNLLTGNEIQRFYGYENSIIYSPDGKYLISTGNCEKSIRVFDVLSGKEIKKLEGHTKRVCKIVFSPDGKYLASADYTTIRIWNILNGNEICKLEGDRKRVEKIVFSPNGKYLASVGESNDEIFIWDTLTWNKIQSVKGDDVSFAPNNKYIAIVKSDHLVEVWNMEIVRKEKEIKIHSDEYVDSLFFSYDGEYVLITDTFTMLRYDIEKEVIEFISSFDDYKNGDDDYIFSPNMEYAVMRSFYRLDLFDLKNGNVLKRIYESENCFFTDSIFFSPDSKYIVILCAPYYWSDENHKKIKIYDIINEKFIENFDPYKENLKSVVCSLDGNYLANEYEDGTVLIWDMLTRSQIEKFKMEKNINIKSFVFDSKRKYFVSIDGNDGFIWDFMNGRELLKFQGTEAVFSPNGKYISIIYNKVIKIFDILTGKEIKEFKGEKITYSLNSRYVINEEFIDIISGDETIKLYDILSGEEVKKFENTKIAYSPNDRYVMIGNTRFNGDVKIWDTVNGNEIFSFKNEFISNVKSFIYLKNKKYIVCTYEGGIMQILSLETKSPIYTTTINSHGEYLTYTPEGFFTGTEWAMKNLVHIVDGMDVIGIDQVYDKLYRPDLVAAKMRGEDISEYAKEVNLASIVRSGNAPAVAIKNLPELSDSRDVTFDICVQNTGGGIGNVSIVLNGKTIRLSEGVASSKGEQKIFRHTVTLQNGQNKIEAFAMNSAGMIESRHASADVSWQGKTSKPNLYVLTVAVNKYRDKDLWLNYCVPDAASIEESFKKQQSGLYQNVCVYSLKDAEVTKEGLEKKFKELSSIVTADDVFVFFVSGHGTAYDDGDYYFIPVNFRYTNKTDIPLNAISKSDLTKNLSLIKAGKTLMMLDTCNSGAFFEDSNKRGMGDKGIFERLSRATGHAILAAASDSQSAMEGYNGHGVFTYVLLDGLAGNADSDGDGFVTLTELSSYVENQVPELSYEKWGYEQVPQKELRRQDFPIAETVLK